MPPPTALDAAATAAALPYPALANCPLVVSCTTAQAVALRARPRADAFVAAAGAFTPRIVGVGA
ncbi:hypothetical protein [Tepidimonas sp.]|uniref:hypothetical protein n=1 Tax=Tepidimonas sp. TaxID=2002775 RepID=UPI003FCDE2DF